MVPIVLNGAYCQDEADDKEYEKKIVDKANDSEHLLREDI